MEQSGELEQGNTSVVTDASSGLRSESDEGEEAWREARESTDAGEGGLKSEEDGPKVMQKLPRITATSKRLLCRRCFTPTIHRLLVQYKHGSSGMWTMFAVAVAEGRVFGFRGQMKVMST